MATSNVWARGPVKDGSLAEYIPQGALRALRVISFLSPFFQKNAPR